MKLDAKVIGSFIIQKVARFYGQQVVIEDLEEPRGQGRWVWAFMQGSWHHLMSPTSSHRRLPYLLGVATKETPEPVQVLMW